MGRAIIKLNDGERDWYLEWSTVVDAPVTYGMTLDEMKAYRQEQNGLRGNADWDQTVERLNRTGCSWRDGYRGDAYSTIAFNRAGVGETCLTAQQMIEMYCHRTGDLRGHVHSHNDEVARCDGKGEWR